MSNDVLVCPDVVIANAGTDSPWVKSTEVYGDADEIALAGTVGDDAIPTYTIQVTNIVDSTPAAGDIHTLQSGGTDINPPAPDKAEKIIGLQLFKAFRIHASAGVTGAVTFGMTRRASLVGWGR